MSEREKVLELFEEQKALMDEKVQAGIRYNRKGFAHIQLEDEDGNAITDAKISVRQTSHEFKYGANLFMLNELETPEKNERYKELMSTFGNMATLPFYWNANEPEQGKTRYTKDSPKIYRRPPIDLCMEFCEKHGIEPREHGLAYGHFFPQWLNEKSVFEIKYALEKRYREIAERYGSRIPTIEVTNELPFHKAETAIYEAEDYVEFCFKLAEKYFPSNQLVINEHVTLAWGDKGRPSDKYYSYIDANMRRGARVDAIGMQFHMFHKREAEFEKTRIYYDPMELYKRMDLYANFGKPLQVTEVTIPAYSNDAEDEEIQAKIIEYLYSIWFSHPNMEQIIYWNMVDGYAHVGNPDPEAVRASMGNMTLGENYYYGGLVRFDMTPKPAYYTIKNLFEKTWHTEELIVTNQSGVAGFNGFYGAYEIEITANGKTVKKELNLRKKAINKFKWII